MSAIHTLTKEVKLLQKIALLREGAVLLLQRSGNEQSRPGCWDLPGGNSEWPLDTHKGFGQHKKDLVREVREETGIELLPESFAQNDLVYFETFFQPDAQMFSIICGWKGVLSADFAPDQVRLSDEHTAFAWVKPSELAEYDFGGSRGEFLAEIITRATQAGVQ
jgi:8-oxo-dGTP diphosphatase